MRFPVLAVAWVAALPVACKDGAFETELDPLTALFAGCADVQVGPVCTLPEEHKLHLFVPGQDRAEIIVRTPEGERTLKPEVTAVDGGLSYAIAIPKRTTRLLARRGDRGFTLPLRAPEPFPIIEQAERLKASHRLEEAVRLLEGALETAASRRRAMILGSIGRIELHRGRYAQSVARFREAMANAEAHGQLSQLSRDGRALAYVLIQRQRRFSEARDLLDFLAKSELDPEGRVALDYYVGLLGTQTGNFREALAAQGRAARGFARLGMRTHLRWAQQATANVLLLLDRAQEARTLLSGIETEESCERGVLSTNRGWAALLAGDYRGARQELRAALSIYESNCPDPAREANALINLATLAVEREELDEARRYLTAAQDRVAADDLRLLLYGKELSARLDLAAKKPKAALATYQELQGLAEASLHSEIHWRALVGRGRALSMLGRTTAAIAAFEQAEKALDDEYLSIPIDAGRGSFLRTRVESSRRLVEHLIEAGRNEEALEAIRRARARVLSRAYLGARVGSLAPDARERWEQAFARYQTERSALEREVADDWKLSKDRLESLKRKRAARRRRLRAALDAAHAALPDHPDLEYDRPADGTLLIAYHPISTGWVAVAATSTGVWAERLDSISETASQERLSQVLLRPFKGAIDEAKRLYLMPYGPLRAVDFHALPYGDDVLLAAVPVAYAVDLPGGAPIARRKRATVVGNPRKDLERAEAEARSVVSVLSSWTEWRAELLVGDSASRRAVLDNIGRSRLFHYAGHGRVAGPAGWESGLLMTAGEVLTVADLLTLESAPEWAVLSGCETGRDAGSSAIPGLGLAQAFLAAGSAGAVATRRPVEDGLASEIVGAIYRGDGQDRLDMVEALRQAQLSVRASSPGADWATFRALVRNGAQP